MLRLRLVSRNQSVGLWLPAKQQWWDLSEEAIQYFQGNNLSASTSSEIENELREMGATECVRDSRTPALKVQSAPSYKPPTVTILHSTWDCNINCPDCYLKRAANGKRGNHLSLQDIIQYLHSFADAGGLFADISGGEALLREDIFDILKASYELGLRTCLVTNGTLLNRDVARKLSKVVDQVTISIDGLSNRHDSFRGNGNFAKSVSALRFCKEQNINTGATTVLRQLPFDNLLSLLVTLSDCGVKQWNLTALRRPWVHSDKKNGRPLSAKELQDLGFVANDKGIEIVADEAILDPAERKTVLDVNLEREEQRWHSTLTVLPDGNVVPCVFHPVPYANIKHMSAAEISDNYRRKELLSYTYETECSRCLE